MADNVVSAATPSPPSGFIGFFLLGLVANELIFLYSETQEAGIASRALVAMFPLLAWQQLRLRESYLLGLCLILIYLTWLSDSSLVGVIGEGLSRSAYLASFILLMALLREGALTSSSVLELGTFLTRQPASRRFVALFCGSHFFAVLINLGALSPLAPIIQRGVRSSVSHGAALDDIAHARTPSIVGRSKRLFLVFGLGADSCHPGGHANVDGWHRWHSVNPHGFRTSSVYAPCQLGRGHLTLARFSQEA